MEDGGRNIKKFMEDGGQKNKKKIYIKKTNKKNN